MTVNFSELSKMAEGRNPKHIPGPTEEERERWKTSLLVGSMAIDSNYIGITRKDFETFRPAYVRDFWKGSDKVGGLVLRFDPETNDKGVYLYGDPGCGKTAILKTLAIMLVKKYPEQVIFTQLKHAIDAMAQDDFHYKTEIQKKLTSCRFLFLDDIGVERSTEWTREQLYAILDQRLHAYTEKGEKKFTFFSSNLTLDQLTERYHSRDVRRFLGLATFYRVKMGHENVLKNKPSETGD